MKKICVALVMVAMLVCIFAPGVSARSRPLWMDQLQNRADKPDSDGGPWIVDPVSREQDTRTIISDFVDFLRSLFRNQTLAESRKVESNNQTHGVDSDGTLK